MKVKTFIFATNEINPYCQSKSNERNPYKVNTTESDAEINDFVKDKKVIDIKTTTHQQGNNPPAFFIDYTILYED